MGGEGRVVPGAVGVDFGKMKGKRVARIRMDSMSPGVAVQDKDKGAGGAGGAVGDGGARSDRWREKSAGGGWSIPWSEGDASRMEREGPWTMLRAVSNVRGKKKTTDWQGRRRVTGRRGGGTGTGTLGVGCDG